jgi:hypothetical protein
VKDKNMKLYYEYNGMGEEAVIFDFGGAYLTVIGWEKPEGAKKFYTHVHSKFIFNVLPYEPAGRSEEIEWGEFWSFVKPEEKEWLQRTFFKTVFPFQQKIKLFQ